MESTNTMNELSLVTKTVESAVDYLHAAPVSVLLVFALALLGVAIRLSHAISNRWAPLVILASGTLSYMFLGDAKKLAEHPFPWAVLALIGFFLGAGGLLVFAIFGKRVANYFPRFDDDEPAAKPTDNNNAPKQ